MPLAIHAAYTRDEILIALGHWDFNNRPCQREGVLHLKERKMDVFFVTLQKSEDEYSPTTMYEDYLISQDQFHWQSHSNTSEAITYRATLCPPSRQRLHTAAVCPRDKEPALWAVGAIPLPRPMPLPEPHRKSPHQYRLEARIPSPNSATAHDGPTDRRLGYDARTRELFNHQKLESVTSAASSTG